MQRRSFLAGAGALATLAGVATGTAATKDRSPGGAASGPLVVDGSDVSDLSGSYLDLLEAGGIDVCHYNGLYGVLSISQVYDFLDQHSGRIGLAGTIADIDAAKSAGKIALILGWQDADALGGANGNDWSAFPPQTSLRAYYELGIRVVNLVYNQGNQFAGGCLDPKMPLTRSGEFLVRKMQEMGILVDCGGHTGEQSSLDIIRIAKRPVICSHSNVNALNRNPRNTSDRVIEGIARTGGVFGVNALDVFLTWGYKDVDKDPERDRPPRAPLGRYVDEIDYLMRLIGPDHIGLGPDFTASEGPSNFRIDPGTSFIFPIEMTYAQSGPAPYVQGFEKISEIGNVRTELQKRGYSTENIQKIMGGNWMRVYRDAWNA